ncbi:MAG: glycerol-3-phosphate acyltransferase [Gammaproteobacteria bacterium RIFCSPHIGHO2_12_FULL_43_28]|nr:MAG: glycerol-3-phosphate acyltransferase [Gammaproteobacteria bacterium RIFCSPHIGHO2_12_FULL_43_28]
MFSIETLLALIIAYLFGSLSSAIIVCRLMRLPDPRTQGSQNPGATNVLRIGGKKAALLTLLGDVLKGVIPVLAAKWYGLAPIGLALVMFAAFIGHLYPIFFRFQGGKGVATLLGCLLALSLPIAAAFGVTWLVLTLVFRYVSLSSIAASMLTPLYAWLITQNSAYALVLALMAVILVYRHRGNIAKLLAGHETKLGAKKQ